MKVDLKSFLLHLFEIHLDRCLVIHLNDIQKYIEYIQTFGNRTKSEIRHVIEQLWFDGLIGNYSKISNDVYIIYR